MLSREENQLLSQVGPGTTMGELVRRYWLPALLSEELPEPDGDPLRVRLLGEDLVAFRDSSGRVGLLDESCPHRCTSLVYGRNEEGGLRCIYHGWKVDVEGRVLEAPSEPPESTFKDRVRAVSYPTREVAGVIWAYMGPPQKQPALPHWEWFDLPEEQRGVTKIFEDCGFAQGAEGSIDSAHSDYLHRSDIYFGPGGRPAGDHSPRLDAEDTPYGFRYAAIRRPDEDADKLRYVRITVFVAPFYVIIPPFRRPGEEVILHQAWVPIDDEHNNFFTFAYNRMGPLPPSSREHARQFGLDRNFGRPERNRSNNHLQGRALMRDGHWSGVTGVNSQDFAVVESMGAITPRHKEHLGASDVAVIRMRRRLIDAARAHLRGEDPPGLDPSIPYSEIRSEHTLIPIDSPWQELAPLTMAPVG